jgi:hypothetical protein
MTQRRKRESLAADVLALALEREEHLRISWLVLDAALEAINVLGAATIDDALALFDEEEHTGEA